MLIARKAYGELDRLFHRVAIASQLVLISGSTVVWLGIYGLYAINHRLAERFLPPWPAAFLVVGMVAGTPLGVGGTTNFMKFHIIGGGEQVWR